MLFTRWEHASRAALLLAFAAGPLAACAGDSTGPAPEAVARVEISPDSAVVALGETHTFSAQALTATGKAVSGRAVQWSSDRHAVATVDGSGVVTAAGAGTARITASIDGVAASVSVRVPAPPPAEVRISPDSAVLFLERSETFTAKAYDAAGAELSGRTVRWASSDANIVSVTQEGVVTAVASGSATISATVDGTSASGTVRARENPVKPTSYENFKEVGLTPHTISLPQTQHWGYHELARGYGDFFGNGNLDMFTATVDYDKNDGPDAATRAVYRFWRNDGGSYVEDNSILVAGIAPCLHSRKAVVADFNQDARPDIFIACHGYDADPFPGEPNQILLSQGDGRYELRNATEAGFWHGATAADLNGDGYPDVILVTGDNRAVYLNDGTGAFTRETTNRLPGSPEWGFEGSIYFTVELVDVNEDGHLDLLLGGHEWDEGFGTSPTGVWLNPGNNNFSNVTPVVIPAVTNEGVVVDFTVTGTGATRTIWLSRTSGGDGTFYESAVLQRFNWSDRTASVVYNVRPAYWVPWIIHYTRNGTAYVGSDDLRTPMEAAMQ